MILQGHVLDRLLELPDNSVDSIVTDPPYELGFMGKSWDASGIAYSVELWREALRVLKPGGHLLSFGSSRGHHRMFCAVEDAGFEIRDTLTWVFGSGFPKSLNVTEALKNLVPVEARCACALRSSQTVPDSQADCPIRHRLCDEQLPAESGTAQDAVPLRGDVPGRIRDGLHSDDHLISPTNTTSPCMSSSTARPSKLGSRHHDDRQPTDCQSNDSIPFGKAENMSPAEQTVERKKATGKLDIQHLGDDLGASSLSEVYPHIPLCEDCGKLKIQDGLGTALKPAAEYICMARKPFKGTVAQNVLAHGTGALNIDGCRVGTETVKVVGPAEGGRKFARKYDHNGENLANTTLSEHEGRWPANFIHDGSEEVTALFPTTESGQLNAGHKQGAGSFGKIGGDTIIGNYGGDSGSAARFFKCCQFGEIDRFKYCAKASRAERDLGLDPPGNIHTTVKPIALMRYLCRMVTPPGGTVLDLFAGSGTTGCAAKMEGFDFILIEREPEYVAIIEKRLSAVTAGFNFGEAA